ncbi:hypothetical protein NPIL_160621 [Nephila pilipes]|uniref:Uncharacterized protein n=1 Tax=Nephila pilipes TaxID=299642 RepID=A0A8X6N4F1_NEPPI|nr:hypothetical protein NPIL_160621 [Nephila pilipes]
MHASTPSPTDVPHILTTKIPDHSKRSYWKNLLLEQFNPLLPAASYINNNRYLPVLSHSRITFTRCRLNEKSSNTAVHGRNVIFFGPASASQFIEGKRNTCSLKYLIVTAPDGLLLDFFICQGSGDQMLNDSADNDLKELDTGCKVALILSENLPTPSPVDVICIKTDASHQFLY